MRVFRNNISTTEVNFSYSHYLRSAFVFAVTISSVATAKASGWLFGENELDKNTDIQIHRNRRALSSITQQTLSFESTEVGRFKLNGTAQAITIRDNYAFVASGQAGLQILDISQDSQISIVGSIGTFGSAQQVVLSDDFAFIADHTGGMSIIDISNMANPSLANVYMMEYPVVNVAVIDHKAIITDANGGLDIIAMPDPAQINQVFINTRESIKAFHVDKGIVYALTTSDFKIINIQDPTHPLLIGSVTYNIGRKSRRKHHVAIVETRAYITMEQYFYIVDISKSNHPVIIEIFNHNVEDTYNRYREASVSNNKFYLISAQNLWIYDVNDPSAPQLLITYPFMSEQRGKKISVINEIAYIIFEDKTSARFDKLDIFDISNAQAPQQIGHYAIPAQDGYDRPNITDFTIVDDIAYISYQFSSSVGGLDIVSVSTPDNPHRISYIDLNAIDDVRVSQGIAYLLMETRVIYLFDISNPLKPIELNAYMSSQRCHDISVFGDKAYLECGSVGIQVIDSNFPPINWLRYERGDYPINDIILKQDALFSIDAYRGLSVFDMNILPPQRYADSSGYVKRVFIRDDIAYIVEDKTHAFRIVDLTDKHNPEILSRLITPDNTKAVFVSGNHAYIANDDAGLLIVDISDLRNPVSISSFKTQKTAKGGISVENNIAYISNSDHLEMIDISNPLEPKLLGDLDVTANRIYVIDSIAYAIGFNFIIETFDVSDPSQPILLDSNKPSGCCRTDVYVSDKLIYSVGEGGLIISDASDPRNIRTVVEYEHIEGTITKIYVKDSIAYLTENGRGSFVVLLLDVSDPSQPTLIDSYDNHSFDQSIKTMTLHKNAIYMAGGSAGLLAIDLPWVSQQKLPNTPTQFAISNAGDYAYVTDDTNQLQIIDYSDFFQPNRIAALPLTATSRDIKVTNDLAIISQGVFGVEVINISNPASPTQVKRLTTGLTNVNSVALKDNKIFLADASAGIIILNTNIEYQTGPVPPVIVNNQLSISEGESVRLTSENLLATDADNDDTQLIFRVDKIRNGRFEPVSDSGLFITSFLQQQIIDGEIQFTHSGLNGTVPTYELYVSDGQLDSIPQSAIIDFNAAPKLINNQLIIGKGGNITLSAENLLATDVDDEDSSLMFEIYQLLHGRFNLQFNGSHEVYRFSQAQVSNGDILFSHDDSDTSPSYAVSVRDSRMQTRNEVADITFNNVNDIGTDNTAVIAASTAAGVAGLAGLLIAGCMFAKKRRDLHTREKHLFARYVRRRLQLKNVDNFNTEQGKKYISIMENKVAPQLKQQGFDIDTMSNRELEVLAKSFADAAKSKITASTNFFGQSKITIEEIDRKSSDIIQAILQHNSNPIMDFQHINSFNLDGDDDGDNSFELSNLFNFNKGSNYEMV